MLDSKKTALITRRRCLKTLGLAGLATAGAVGYARFIEPFQVEITSRDISLPDKYAHLDGLRIVQLTDFHYRPESEEELITSIVEKTNSLKPDLILLTGDYLNHDKKVIPPLVKILSKLQAKHGILASVGNHDIWGISRKELSRHFQKASIDMLVNKHSILELGSGEKLAICGLDSAWGGQPRIDEAVKSLKADLPLISMVHEPDLFDDIAEHARTFLQLSGHTHGGQCRVPLIGYAPAKVRYGKNYIYGSFQKAESSLFVSRGIGTTGLQVRFACKPEIALLKLKIM